MKLSRRLLTFLPLAFISSLVVGETTSSLTNALVTNVIIDHEITLDAKVEAVNHGTLSAQTDGQVMETLADVGDFVEKDAVILRLKDTQQVAALRQATAAVESAQAQFVDADKEFQRVKDLQSRGLVSQAQLDRTTAVRNSATASLKSAQASQIAHQQQLDYTRVKAPYTGIIEQRLIEVGEIVHPGTPLFSGMSLDRVRVVAAVSQTDIDAVRHYLTARVRIKSSRFGEDLPVMDVDSDLNVEENVLQVSGSALTFFAYADPQTSSFMVRVELPPGQKGLYPGMYLKTSFKIGERQALVIPKAAVVHRASLTAVYVINGEEIEFRQVRLGKELSNGTTEVLAGLQAEEKIALEPHVALRLRNQLKVESGK